jgi:hypothetical protein
MEKSIIVKLSVALVILVASGVLFFNKFINDNLVISNLAGIGIEITKDEVEYVHGAPDYVYNYGDLRNPYIFWRYSVDAIKDDFRNYKAWLTYSSDMAVYVFFNEENKVEIIECSRFGKVTEEVKKLCRFNGITLETDENIVYKKFGKPTKESISKGKKVMIYERLNLAITLEKQRVEKLTIAKNIIGINF